MPAVDLLLLSGGKRSKDSATVEGRMRERIRRIGGCRLAAIDDVQAGATGLLVNRCPGDDGHGSLLSGAERDTCMQACRVAPQQSGKPPLHGLGETRRMNWPGSDWRPLRKVGYPGPPLSVMTQACG